MEAKLRVVGHILFVITLLLCAVAAGRIAIDPQKPCCQPACKSCGDTPGLSCTPTGRRP